MDQVWMECGQHGLQVVDLSGAIGLAAGTVNFGPTATTACPVCGQRGSIVQGSYIKDSPAAPVRAVLHLTAIQAQAIRGILLPAAQALADDRYSDARADALLQKKILELEATNADLARELDALRTKLKRSKLTSVIAGVAAAVGFVADVGGAGETIRGIVEWTTAQFEAGGVPDFSNLPPALYPDGRKPDFGAGR
ncbi:hypothetical protein [Microbacterium sp. 2FI]|uniref:hypothetical protein n=1 Tax=Microbacterium sp. 2FI TaxID=2502193 RepID=UPI0010FA07A5|nr:hypothetical protein [Microbacterium sp. 2FI]